MGSPSSGNFGHAGRPGEVGGSISVGDRVTARGYGKTVHPVGHFTNGGTHAVIHGPNGAVSVPVQDLARETVKVKMGGSNIRPQARASNPDYSPKGKVFASLGNASDKEIADRMRAVDQGSHKPRKIKFGRK